MSYPGYPPAEQLESVVMYPNLGKFPYPCNSISYPQPTLTYPRNAFVYPQTNLSYFQQNLSNNQRNSVNLNEFVTMPQIIYPSPYPTKECMSYQSYTEASKIKCTPTLKPAQPFNHHDDADQLRKAMKGLGTDEKLLINVLAKRTSYQRQQIALAFKTTFGKDLEKELKSESSGDFRELLKVLTTPIYEFYAKCIHDACSGVGTKESILVQILCTLTNQEMKFVIAAYEKLFDKKLEKVIRNETAGYFERILIVLLTAARDESGEVIQDVAIANAKALHNAGEVKTGTDESTFIRIFGNTSYRQLAETFESYKQQFNTDIIKVIKKEFSGDIEEALLAIAQMALNRTEYFAKVLHDSMSGVGTNDETLIRIIVTRSEIDMGEIKVSYQKLYEKSLKEAIQKETKGDYQTCLLTLIGE